MKLGLGLGLQYKNNRIGGSSALILDTYSANVGTAKSLEYLISSFIGNDVIIVRRDVTLGGVSERGFTPTEINDGTLVDWCNGGNGFVTTIYDQVNNFDYTQTFASLQGAIVTNGFLNTLNGKPVIKRVNSDSFYSSNYNQNTAVDKTFFYVGGHSSSLTKGCLYSCFNGGGSAIYLSGLSDSSTSITLRTTLQSVLLNNSAFTPSTRNDVFLAFQNQINLSFLASNFTFQTPNLQLGYDRAGFGFIDFQEEIIYNADNLTNRNAIDANINSRYNIY